jgi:predicted pyridoxine 5'-phosphate oxidase superfamily flavin-nucleotide-binding protein
LIPGPASTFRLLAVPFTFQTHYKMAVTPYHAGEQEMQRKTGEEIPAYRNGRIIGSHIAPGAVQYIEQQPFMVVSSQDGQGRLWSSVLSGENGYVKVLDEKTLRLDKRLMQSNPADGFWENVQMHPYAGMLFIEPASRRRYRLNGRIRLEQNQLFLTVTQAYVNCPKYIQRRLVTRGETPVYPAAVSRATGLPQALTSWIQGADTFFVGSSNGAGDLDASHRGGNPGFIEVLDDATLRIPDYEGNSMYNTLGNFLVYPQAGLLFVDFEHHRTLQLTGTASMQWPDGLPDPQSAGSGRSWTFTTAKWVLMENLRNLDWTFVDYSPFNPGMK